MVTEKQFYKHHGEKLFEKKVYNSYYNKLYKLISFITLTVLVLI